MKNSLLITLSFLLFACGGKEETINKEIDIDNLHQHIKTLASDEFAGRLPSTPGEDKTINYLAEQFEVAGFSPGNGDSFFQEVPLMSITSSNDMALSITDSEGNTTNYQYLKEMVGITRRIVDSIAVEGSEMVFVGYGIVAPEFNWNDYEGVDVTGKTVVVIVNDPGYVTKDQALFTGNAMTYYGRHTYKYEEAARQGAAAVLIIHQTGPAGYPWAVVEGGWSGTNFGLVTEDGNASRCAFEGWMTEEVAKGVFEKAGLDFEEALDSATKPGFKAAPLNQQLNLVMNNTIERSVSYNVIAKLEGSVAPDEYIIYTAHWDHMGTNEDLEGDKIFNGAVDNATGTAALLELARVYAANGPHERTILFLAVTAEEQGLLGSEYYATNPIYPLAQTVADINMDAMNVVGQMKDITVVGYGNSQLDEYLKKAAGDKGVEVRPEPQPEKGYYFRSDHFNFAKAGVPALYTETGTDHVEKGPEWGMSQQQDYTANRYHKPGDEYDPAWDLSGLELELEILYQLGADLANNKDWPEWNEGVSFKNARDQQRGSN